jgi:hypothetical protein
VPRSCGETGRKPVRNLADRRLLGCLTHRFIVGQADLSVNQSPAVRGRRAWFYSPRVYRGWLPSGKPAENADAQLTRPHVTPDSVDRMDPHAGDGVQHLSAGRSACTRTGWKPERESLMT